MACPSSRSKVTTHTHSSQEENRAHGHRLAPPSAASSCRGEPEPSNGFITTGSELRDLRPPSSGPPSQLCYRHRASGGWQAAGAPCWTPAVPTPVVPTPVVPTPAVPTSQTHTSYHYFFISLKHDVKLSRVHQDTVMLFFIKTACSCSDSSLSLFPSRTNNNKLYLCFIS